MTSSAAWLVAGVAALGLTGCAAPALGTASITESSTQTSLAVPPPLYRFGPSVVEQLTVDVAVSELATECMQRRGLAYSPPRPTLAERRAEERELWERRYGPTNITDVQRFGYLPSQHTSEPRPARLSGDEARALIGDRDTPGCLARARERVVGAADTQTAFTLAESLGNQAWLRSRHDPRVAAAIADWATCMRGRGHHITDPLDSGMLAGRAEPAPGEVAQAAADVECKQATGLVRRWRAVEVEYADRVAARHQIELDRGRTRITLAVQRACTVLGSRTYGRPCGRADS